jgi:predicted N-acyltransferase
MTACTPSYKVVWMDSISRVDKAIWDRLALPLETPFLEWNWLNQMEESGSVSAKTGWNPYHLTVWSERDLVAAAPLYIKTHSVGEFVFDHAWAELADRLELDYYPKLVGMSPFTPVSGYRFLMAPGENEGGLTALMIDEIDGFCRRNRISGSSFLYVDPEWREMVSEYGFRSWMHQSFSWQNWGYQNFEDFLSIFNSNQRHNIRRERNKIKKKGVTIKAYSGEEIPPSYVPLMHGFYERTNDKFGPWGCRYLNRTFFEGIYDHYRHRLVLMAAFQEDNQKLPVGMSFFLRKSDRLYGRYWGSLKEINALHFNACYYYPIEWAIHHGISQVDPGIGSEHKIRRGFLAVPNYSLHRFYDNRLQHVLNLYIGEINRMEREHIDTLNSRLPFAKKTSDRILDPDISRNCNPRFSE